MRRNSGGNAAPADRDALDADAEAFAELFRDVHRKCFATEFAAPLTESESHRLSVEIAESTGLEIGWKSLKNYSHFLQGRASRAENPSLPTLDTLARYVAGAPRTDETQRRTRERHYPYWVRYREERRRAAPASPLATEGLAPAAVPRPAPARRPARRIAIGAAVAAMIVVALVVWRPRSDASRRAFTDDFDDVSGASLAERGWSVQRADSAHWAQRGARAGHLTLFTLEGDNWPQPGKVPGIRNLLSRRVVSDCFVADVRYTSFFPRQNWQQAGILLVEDTALAGRSVRMSVAYNDFSGGFAPTREVIVQGITSLGRSADQPEEFVHHRLFVVDSATERLVSQNLEHVALRLEKRGSQLRLLAAAGSMPNAAFKEVGVAQFDFRPSHVALFAMKGFGTTAGELPVHVDAFSQSAIPCAR